MSSRFPQSAPPARGDSPSSSASIYLSADLLPCILACAPTGMLAVDADGVIIAANDLVCTQFGYPKAELVGRSESSVITSNLTDTDVQANYMSAQDAMTTEAWQTAFGLRKDGSRLAVEVARKAVTISGVSGVATLVSVIDVTKRKRLEERFRLVTDSSPHGIVKVDAEGRIILVNVQTERMFGYKREELLGQPLELLVPEGNREAHQCHRKTFMAEPVARNISGRILVGRRKDGSTFPIEVGLNPVRILEGDFVLASVVDITERVRAEEGFRQVVESAPSGLLVVNTAGIITLTNTALDRLFAYDRGELVGQLAMNLIPTRYHARYGGSFDYSFSTPSTHSLGANEHVFGCRKNGSEFPLEIGFSPVTVRGEVATLASVIDPTERLRAEQLLRERDAARFAFSLSSSFARGHG